MLTFEQIKELIEIVAQNRLLRLEIERAGFTLRIDGRDAATGEPRVAWTTPDRRPMMNSDEGFSRRRFLRYAMVSGVAVPVFASTGLSRNAHASIQLPADPDNLSGLEQLHIPKVTLPPVVEDGSQAHGAMIRGKVVGQFGDASGFSCMGFKLLGALEGGYLITKHEDVYWKAALCCQHMGRSPDPGS